MVTRHQLLTAGSVHVTNLTPASGVTALRHGMKAGDTLTSGEGEVDIRPGNAMPLGRALYTLNAADPQLVKARGFNPR
jgi:hypothetical protein